jgi:DHA2 family multidrug resistance protein-like MFS transporter
MARSIPAKATRREWIGLAVLALACVLYAMDLTVLHLAVPKLSTALQPSSAQLLWIIDIYGFFVAGSLITMGTLGDRIGRRKLLLIGATLFAVVSVIAAFSNSAEMLIVCRALMGIAGATLAPGTLSLIFNMFRDPDERAKAIGVWISSFSAGGAIGPVLGGILLQYFWWGSVFLLAVPVMALLLLLGPRVLPEYRDENAGKLDLLSAVMSLTAILAIIYGIKEIAQSGLNTLPVLVMLVGLVIGFLFIRRQLGLKSPLFDLKLFRIPRFSVSLAANVMAVFIAVGYFLFIAQYLQLVLGLSPLESGLWSLPSAVGFIVGSNVAPRFIHLYKPGIVLAVAMAISAIGLVLLTQVSVTGGLALVVAASLIISLALAPAFSLTTELIVSSAPEEKAGSASGISETGAELGGALGISILGSIGTAIYRASLANQLPATIPNEVVDAARDTLGAAVGVASQLPAEQSQALLAVAREAFVQGLHIAALIAAAVALFATIMVFTLLRNIEGKSAETRATNKREPELSV